ncbi:MAG: hypothetical protein KDB35_01385 [Acidimicrobiales bacterium]|nr:hypothetical protein [Acidimicrobiales bacterium]MCB1015342.1 hypothetical protein [Acidimicrobiales bacterium]MCB9373435.1 hypothetical protein [Microthrixaceae bacterium]
MTKRIVLSLVLVAGLLLGIAAPVSARGGDAVRVSGDCTRRTDWKLKAKARDGGLETEFEVDSNRNGQQWTVKIKQNGVVVYEGTQTTLPPSGSFSVEQAFADNAGTDRFVAIARNPRSGERCRGVLSL